MSPLSSLIPIVLSITYIPLALEDFRSREVSDFFIALPYINFIYTFYVLGILSLLALALTFMMALAGWALYKLEWIGSGDVLAMPLVVSAFYAYPWPIYFLALVSALHMLYSIARNGFRLRRVRRGEAEDSSKYIPLEADGKKVEGVVDERYEKVKGANEVVEELGVPLAGYIALAGFLGAAAHVLLPLLLYK